MALGCSDRSAPDPAAPHFQGRGREIAELRHRRVGAGIGVLQREYRREPVAQRRIGRARGRVMLARSVRSKLVGAGAGDRATHRASGPLPGTGQVSASSTSPWATPSQRRPHPNESASPTSSTVTADAAAPRGPGACNRGRVGPGRRSAITRGSPAARSCSAAGWRAWTSETRTNSSSHQAAKRERLACEGSEGLILKRTQGFAARGTMRPHPSRQRRGPVRCARIDAWRTSRPAGAGSLVLTKFFLSRQPRIAPQQGVSRELTVTTAEPRPRSSRGLNVCWQQ